MKIKKIFFSRNDKNSCFFSYLIREGVTASKIIKEDFLKLMNGEKTSNGQFITRIKDTMQIYRKTKEWRRHAMNAEELIEMTKAEAKQEEIKCMKKTLSRYRFLQVPEATIKQYLEEDYGDSFSKEEIEKIMKEV